MELIGRRFGHIRVTEVVGSGGMGDVYAGYDEKLERRVALKVLNADQRLDEEARQRLLREARALSKLEHPNICRIHDYIETGDVDLLVLEYIDGRTLHDALNENLPRGEKLRIAISIAEVLVRAHRAGIVHRDLKPENVMLTRTGEVKVLDFGLARWLNRARKSGESRISPVRLPVRPAEPGGAMTEPFHTPSPGDSDTGRREYLATAVGITLGTPIFMSPEQARGETLTPASDMFSFGLLLQSLFTGTDPHPMDLTAREIILRAARGQTLPVQGVAGDVTALINRLKQFAPADRLTAIETQERLRFLANKTQRIARRAIAAAVVLITAIGAWRYTVDLRQARDEARRAYVEAARRRAQAEQLIEFTVGDLRKKLEPVGQLAILDDAAQRALAYFASLEPEHLSVQDLVKNARALHQLGEVRIAQGKLGDAMRAFQQSVVLSSAASKRDAKNPEAQLSLATSHFWVGNGYRLQGDLPKALQHLTEYMNVGETLARQYPDNDEYRLERAYGHSNVATILEAQGQYRAALRHHEVTRSIKEARLAADPANAEKKTDIANTYNKIGFVLQLLGDLRGALASFRREMEIYRGVVQENPSHVIWAHRLAVSQSYTASVLEVLGDYDAAFALREQEVAGNRALHARDPENAEWQRNLAIALMRRGNLMRIRGIHDAALVDYAGADNLVGPLIVRDPSRRSWQRDQAVIRTGRARALLAAGSAAEAKRVAADAATSLEAHGAQDKILPRHIADANLVLGDANAALGNDEAARQAWTRGFTALRDVAASTNDLETIDVWSQTLLRLGRNAEASPLVARLARAAYIPATSASAVPKRPN